MAIDLFYDNIDTMLKLVTPSNWDLWQRCVFVALIFGVIWFFINRLNND